MTETLFDIVYGTVPPNVVVDMVGTIAFTTLLLFIDSGLRFLIEAMNYNKARCRSNSLWNIVKTIVWQGWGSVYYDGHMKRFLASKGFRNSLIVKMGWQYPLIFSLSACAYSLPDTVVMGQRFDVMISFIFMMLPVVCEVTSIIEKLNELEVREICFIRKALLFLKEFR